MNKKNKTGGNRPLVGYPGELATYYRSVREHDKRVDELVRNPVEAMRIWETHDEISMPNLHTSFFLAAKALAKLTAKQP